MYRRHEREKYKMADAMWFILYTFHKQSYFFWLVHVENENSGKYMRLRANLWFRCMGAGWVSREQNFRADFLCSFDGRATRKIKQKINEFMSFVVLVEIYETLRREKQRKFKITFVTEFSSIFRQNLVFANTHKWTHQQAEAQKKSWWRFMKWNLYVSLFYFQNPLNT